jgi:hypothetical protein
MLPLYGKIQYTLWQGKGRASIITIALNILECFGSLDRERSVGMVINIYGVLVNFA